MSFRGNTLWLCACVCVPHVNVGRRSKWFSNEGCAETRRNTQRGAFQKKRRDAHTHSLEMKLLPRTEIGQQRTKEHTQKCARGQAKRGMGIGRGRGRQKRDNAETTSEFQVNDSIKCGFLISLCVARFHLPTGCYATPTCCCCCSLPPPASHTLLVACNMMHEAIPKKTANLHLVYTN